MKNNFKSAEITTDCTKMARSFAKQMGVNAQKVKSERNRIDREKRERVLMRGF
jgi:hypothetical protein